MKQGTRTPGSGGFTTGKSTLPNVEKRTIIESGCKNVRDLCGEIMERFPGSKTSPIGNILKVETTGKHYDQIKQYIAEHKEPV
jgi:hypothetical protein